MVDAGGSDTGPVIDCTNRPADAPSTRGETNGVYDARRDRIVVYGGNVLAPVDCMPMTQYTNELWALQLDCGSWERIEASGGPGVRARHATTVDTMRNRMIVFGGREVAGFGSYTNFADVWAFDLTNDTWQPIETTGTGPSPRSSSIVLYDAPRDRLIVYGGNTSADGFSLVGVDDLYALDLATNTWTPIDAPGPAGRLYHGGVVVGDAMIVYGGTPNYDGPFYGDAWAFSLTGNTWRMIHAGGGVAPAARFGGEIYADPERNRILLFAGHDGTAMGNRNDVWALDLSAGTWSVVRDGDTLNGVSNGVCDFPSDFTIPEENSPERRYSFVHVQSSTTAYAFGGKTDCGNVNDVWALDLAAGTWRSVRPATGGEACNRTGRTGCTTLCF